MFRFMIDGFRDSSEALPKTDEMCNIVANRHDGQSRFAIAPATGCPSGDSCNCNVGSSPIGQSRFVNALSSGELFALSKTCCNFNKTGKSRSLVKLFPIFRILSYSPLRPQSEPISYWVPIREEDAMCEI